MQQSNTLIRFLKTDKLQSLFTEEPRTHFLCSHGGTIFRPPLVKGGKGSENAIWRSVYFDFSPLGSLFCPSVAFRLVFHSGLWAAFILPRRLFSFQKRMQPHDASVWLPSRTRENCINHSNVYLHRKATFKTRRAWPCAQGVHTRFVYSPKRLTNFDLHFLIQR